MNLILCNENCKNQKDGYCRLEGQAQITNALASPCCYFDEKQPKNRESEKNNDKA